MRMHRPGRRALYLLFTVLLTLNPALPLLGQPAPAYAAETALAGIVDHATSPAPGGDQPQVRTQPRAASSAGPVVQVTTDAVDNLYPSIVQAADGTLWVIWCSSASGNYDIWFKTSTDGGATWSADTQLTIDGALDCHPAIARTADGTLWVVWYSHRSGNADIWYKASSDGGATWSADAQLTSDMGDDQNAAIAQTGDGKVWVVWSSDRSGNRDIWCKTSSDGGATWSADVRLTSGTGDDWDPAVADTTDGKVWVLWFKSGGTTLW